jgi:hypothetical protein
VEAAYDMLLMQSLSQRRAGKVADNSIRYADVKPVKSAGAGTVPQWMQATMKNAPITFETPSSSSLASSRAFMAHSYVAFHPLDHLCLSIYLPSSISSGSIYIPLNKWSVFC